MRLFHLLLFRQLTSPGPELLFLNFPISAEILILQGLRRCERPGKAMAFLSLYVLCDIEWTPIGRDFTDCLFFIVCSFKGAAKSQRF
jgi:hypothetical protein